MALGARVNETYLVEPKDHDVDGVRIKIVCPNARKQRSVAYAQLPYAHVPGINPIAMDVNDTYTMQCGGKQRLLRKVPKPKIGTLCAFKRFVERWCRDHILPVHPLEFEEWLDTTGYNEHRKEQLRVARQLLPGGRPSAKQCSSIEMHGKRESYPQYKHARAINSRSDAFKAYSGPFFKAIETELYKHPYFVKHMTPEERMERVLNMRVTNSFCYTTDFTAFESHFVPIVLDACECVLYKHCLKCYPIDANIICDAITGINVMKTRQGQIFQCKGRRMSGDMCTSLGNGFTNLMLALFIAEQKSLQLDGIVEGDDGLFVVNGELSAQDWLELGFTIKIDQCTEPTSASFCGLIFGDDKQVIRDPARFLSTFGWTDSYITATEPIHMELLRAKSLSALHETPQCPIVGLVARKAFQFTQGYKPRYTDRWRAMNTPEWVPREFAPTEQTRLLFAKCYGIDVPTQIDIERRIGAGDMSWADLIPKHADMADYASKFIEILAVDTSLALAQFNQHPDLTVASSPDCG